MLISVIIPLFNKEKYIKRAINSVLNQSYKNFELIVVNDGSTDKSADIVNSINDSRLIVLNKTNGGLSSARNYGIKNSKGEFISFLDADDEWEDKFLEKCLFGFEKNKEAILVCSDLKEILNNQKNLKRRALPFNIKEEISYWDINDYIKTLYDGYFLLSGSSVLIKNELIKKNNLLFFKESEPAEDINYWLRLNSFGKFIFCDYMGVYYHRDDSDSIMNKSLNISKQTPPFFYNIDLKNYSNSTKNIIGKFLEKEFYKKAFQNRGLKFQSCEFDNSKNSLEFNSFQKLVYLFIRLCPQFLFDILKGLKK